MKIIKVGVDLDGVVAEHSLSGFWVWLRKLKEKILIKMHSSTYYYPDNIFEQLGWMAIDWARRPFTDKDDFFASLVKKDGVQFYLVTSRFKFLEKLTKDWLKKHRLDSCFYQVLINTDNINPFIFKAKTIKNLGLDFFIDDDFGSINYLKNRTAAKLYWVVPGHKNKNDNADCQIESCSDFLEALRKIFTLS